MSGLFALGARWQRMKDFRVRRQAIENCLTRTDDPTRQATLRHALDRVGAEESNRNLIEALSAPGFINGRRTNYN